MQKTTLAGWFPGLLYFFNDIDSVQVDYHSFFYSPGVFEKNRTSPSVAPPNEFCLYAQGHSALYICSKKVSDCQVTKVHLLLLSPLLIPQLLRAII